MVIVIVAVVFTVTQLMVIVIVAVVFTVTQLMVIVRCRCFLSVLGTTHFAQEALAGLASKEDFTNVALRKTDHSTRAITGEYLPHSDLMLLHVKGETTNLNNFRESQGCCSEIRIRVSMLSRYGRMAN